MATWSLYDDLTDLYGTFNSVKQIAVDNSYIYFSGTVAGAGSIYRWTENKNVVLMRGPDAGVSYELIMFNGFLYSLGKNTNTDLYELDVYTGLMWVNSLTLPLASGDNIAYFTADKELICVGIYDNTNPAILNTDAWSKDGSHWIIGSNPYPTNDFPNLRYMPYQVSAGLHPPEIYQNTTSTKNIMQFGKSTNYSIYQPNMSSWEKVSANWTSTFPGTWFGCTNYELYWRKNQGISGSYQYSTDLINWTSSDSDAVPLPVINSIDTIGNWYSTGGDIVVWKNSSWVSETFLLTKGSVKLGFNLTNSAYAIETGVNGAHDWFIIYRRSEKLALIPTPPINVLIFPESNFGTVKNKAGGTYRINDVLFPMPHTRWDIQNISIGLRGLAVNADYRIHTWNWPFLTAEFAEKLFLLYESQQDGNIQLTTLETDSYNASSSIEQYGTVEYDDFIIINISSRTRGLPFYEDFTVNFEVLV